MDWLRNEYNNGNNLRTPLKNFTNQDGPTGSVETTYSWDYGGAHFIALNEYWNGGTIPGSDVATDGDIVSELYDWLLDDLETNTEPIVFVFGHEPAFPYNRHVGDSLDKYEANRDAFWSLLETYGVQAYFCAHTHYYSKHQGDKNHIGNVWQFDVGIAGDDFGDGLTYFDVVISNNVVTVDVYRDNGTGTFYLVESIEIGDAGSNSPPVAMDDAYSTDEGITLNIPAPGVLANDTDADADLLTAVKDTDPIHGVLTLEPDGSFSYTPYPGFSRADSFSYHADDSADISNIATVTIIVNPEAYQQVIYDDALSDGWVLNYWDNRSSPQPPDPYSTTDVYSGDYALEVNLNVFRTMLIQRYEGFNTGEWDAIEFMVTQLPATGPAYPEEGRFGVRLL